MILISGDYADPDADSTVFPLQRRTNQWFAKHKKVLCDNSAIKELSVVLRVSGRFEDFGSGPPENLEHLTASACLTVDLPIPESAWKGRTANEFRSYFFDRLHACLTFLVDAANDRGLINSVTPIQACVTEGIEELRCQEYSGEGVGQLPPGAQEFLDQLNADNQG